MSEESNAFLPFEEEPSSAEQVEYPYIGDRVQSTFIDFIFIMVVIFSCSALMNNFDDVPGWVRASLFGIWILYEPFCTSRGFTLGNYIKGIRVRRSDNITERIAFFPALIRFIVKCLLGWVSFLTVHGNKQRRAMHDMVASSVVIRNK
jgi:uncharacterized RDD family membrane protein YckC